MNHALTALENHALTALEGGRAAGLSEQPPGELFGELCSRVFGSLSRRDQRVKAEQYLRGLLLARGRKSMRNIAGYLGSSAAEQSLHHFISSSTWDWELVRDSLAGYLEQVAPPQAWVVRPIVIPKTGTHSVGVERRFVPELGQAVNCQQAYGVWAASERITAPVGWRLFLPAGWTADQRLRKKAKIPGGTWETTLGECAAEAAVDAAGRWGDRNRPVVLDVADADLAATIRRFRTSGTSFVARVAPGTRVTAADLAVPGLGGEHSAQQLIQLARTLWRPVDWTDPAGQVQTSMVSAVRVELPGRHVGPLLLFGEWTDVRRPPRRFWLTDRVGAFRGSLLRLGRLADRVDLDFTETAERVGVLDFEGRCFRGWHRHATLASVAHTAAVLTARRTGAQLLEQAA